MLKNIKKRLKNQRGVTLVELLAVVVILGIIAAIAVPNIGGIIDKTKKDAHVANAQQMADAARLYVLGENVKVAVGSPQTITLAQLVSSGYIENMVNPSDNTDASTDNNYYHQTGSDVVVSKGTNGEYTFVVTLKHGATGVTKTHYLGEPSKNKNATL